MLQLIRGKYLVKCYLIKKQFDEVDFQWNLTYSLAEVSVLRQNQSSGHPALQSNLNIRPLSCVAPNGYFVPILKVRAQGSIRSYLGRIPTALIQKCILSNLVIIKYGGVVWKSGAETNGLFEQIESRRPNKCRKRQFRRPSVALQLKSKSMDNLSGA